MCTSISLEQAAFCSGACAVVSRGMLLLESDPSLMVLCDSLLWNLALSNFPCIDIAVAKWC